MKEKTIREERIKVEEWKTKHLKTKDGTKKDVVGQGFKECMSMCESDRGEQSCRKT